jgi:hypothetical protein
VTDKWLNISEERAHKKIISWTKTTELRNYVHFYAGQNVNGKNEVQKIKQFFEEEEERKLVYTEIGSTYLY